MRMWLKEFRAAHNRMSQSELSKLLGIAPTTLSGYELGTRNPSVSDAKRMAKVLKVNWTIFFETPLSDTRKKEEAR